MSEDKNIRLRLAAAILAVLLLFAISITVYQLFIPIDLTALSGRIESLIEARTGRRVLFDHIAVRFLPEPDITLKGLRVFEGKELILTAGELRIRLHGLPFPGRTVVIENIDATGAELFVNRRASKTINLSGFFNDFAGGRGGHGFEVRSLDVRDGAVSITDSAAPRPVSFKVSGVEARMTESKNGLVYEAKGTLLPASAIVLSGEGSTAGVTGVGSINNFAFERLNPYLSGSGSEFLKGTAGIDVSYALGESRSLKGVVRYRDLAFSSAALAKPILSEMGVIPVAMRFDGGLKDLDVAGARIMVNGVMASMDLKLSDVDAAPYIKLNASTARVPFKSLKDLMPVNALNGRAADVINRITPFGGALTVKNLYLQGPLEAVKKGRVFEKPVDAGCDIRIDGLRYGYRGLSGIFSGMNGLVALKDGVVTFKGSGAYGKTAIDDIAWEMTDIPDTLSFSLGLRSSGDASVILKDIKEFAPGRPFDRIRASGSIDLKLALAGELAAPEIKRFAADTTVRDGAFSYAGFPLSLSSLDGGVSFDNDRVAFRGLRGTDGRSDVRVDGYIKDWLKAAPFFDLAGQGRLSKETVVPFVRNAIFDNLAVTGTVAFKGKVKGTNKKIFSTASVDTSGARIEYGGFVRKASAYPVLAEGSFELSGARLFIRDLTVSFGQSSININGAASLDKRLFDLRLLSSRVMITDIGEVSPYLASEAAGGLVTFDMKLAGSGADSSYDGTAGIRDGRFKTPLIARRVRRINALARFTGNNAVIKIENMTVGDSEITGTVHVPDVAGRVVNFDIFSPRLFVEDFIDLKAGGIGRGAAGTTDPPTPRRGAGKVIIGRGRVVVKEGGAWGHAFHDFSTRVSMTDNIVLLEPVSATIDRGLIQGEAIYYRGASGLLFETDLTITGADIKRTISTFGGAEKFLSGSLNGKLSISAKRGAVPFASGLNGAFSLRSEKGKLWQFLFFTKIFSIVNVFSINELFRTGLPYKFISGDFSIKDGIISTDNLVFDSRSMRMSAMGKISLPERSIDSDIAVKPFVTLDYILSRIPIAGWIIEGKEKSTLTMYFEVKGPVKDPDVTPLTVTGVGKGILGMLQRLIEAPIKIIKPVLE